MPAPEFSVIIPAFNVQGYLRQAVVSVAGDDGAEVIIVDDRSTDGTGVLADELAQAWPHVTVVRPEQNSGLGEARNLGLRHATGEYVVFLDGDDYLAPGAFEHLRQAIAGVTPDIVIFGYQRLYPSGDKVEGIQRAPLQHEGPFTALERPQIFDVLNVAWNKVYRRAFLERMGLSFPVGYYEDIPWTYPLLASAESIVGLDEPLYLYRQRWSGSILRSTDARHLEIIDQFERLMAVMERLGLSAEVQGEIFTRAYRNIVTLATVQRHRIPADMRRAYYERAQASARAHVPDGYTLPREGDKWEHMQAMWTADYATFIHRRRLTTAMRRTRSVAGRGARIVWNTARAPFKRRWAFEYHRRYDAVDRSLVMLESLWGMSPRLNPLAIAEELRSTHPHLRLVWSVKPEHVADVPEGTEVVVKGSREYERALATAGYFFVDANLPGWWRKRRGQVVTQLHHGTPLKLMGVEERGKSKAWREGLLRRCQRWDYSVVSNAYSVETWQHSYPVRCETLEYGYPRNDVLVNADASAKERARAELGLPASAPVLLYAPTFRERDAAIITAEELNAMAAAAGPDAVLLFRGHYFAAPGGDDALSAQVRDVSGRRTVEQLYLAADVLVTDYSSAMFDYANLRRPIVLYVHDWEQYQADRGTYIDITRNAPGPVARTMAELEGVLRTRAYDADEHHARLERFATIFCCFDTGHAARDIVARVIDGERPDLPERTVLPALEGWNMERLA